jgi:ATP-dependent Lon protease
VLIPAGNEKDLPEIPKNIKDKLKILPVKWIDEVLEHALQHLPVPARSGEVAASERDKKTEEAEKTKATLPH